MFKVVCSRGRQHDDAGVVATEVAIIMPLIIVLSILPFEWALRWHARHSIEVAAEQCVDSAQAWEGGDGVGAASAITSQAGNLSDVSITVSVGATDVSCTVSATPRFSLFNAANEFTATATGPRERFVTP